MAILKQSSSGKQWQVVLSEDLPAGTVLGCGKGSLSLVSNGSIPFARLSILPILVSSSKFPPSEIWGSDDSQVKAYKEQLSNFKLSTSNDGFSPKFSKERKQKSSYSQRVTL